MERLKHNRFATGPADDARPPVPIQNAAMASVGLGLHGLDYQLFAGDLLTVTADKIDAMAEAST